MGIPEVLVETLRTKNEELERRVAELDRQFQSSQDNNSELERKVSEANHTFFELGKSYGTLMIDNDYLRAALTKATAATEFTLLRQANLERQKLWEGGGLFPASFYGLAMVSEAGEAGNVVKKLERERLGARGSRATIEQLAQEMADTIIYMDLLAAHYKIEIWPAVVTTFNNVSEREGFTTRLL